MRSVAPAALLLVLAGPAAARGGGWATVSDIGAYGLGAVALGLPALRADGAGVGQAAASLAGGELAAQGLKAFVRERRPDGSNYRSFPSAHTSLAFAAAATLQRREGWGVGAPAYAAAALVGLARVEARKHHWYDVVAGAAIGEASGLLFTRRPHPRSALVPWSDGEGGGVAVALTF